MRGIYAERREALLTSLAAELGDRVELVRQNSGFEVLVKLEPKLDERVVRAEAVERACS